MAETPSDAPEEAGDPARVPDKEAGLRRIQAEREALGRGEGMPAAAWIGGHRDALMLGGAAVFVLVLPVANLSVGWFLLVALLLSAYELLVYRLGATITQD
jgi:hypothetical protein